MAHNSVYNSEETQDQTRICDVCKNLEICDEILASSLLESSNNGCQLCSLLKAGVCRFVEDFGKVKKLQLVCDQSLFVYVRDEEKLLLRVVEFYTLADCPAPWPKLGLAQHVSDNSSNDECIGLAKRWLIGCLTSHSKCRRLRTPTLPTRIISVGNCDEEVRLCVNSRKKRAEYVALSHCWGSESPITLQQSTFKSMKQKIAFDSTSKTFQEAVDVTRRLGISYIWIDSLCILQDDVGDWTREASRMGNVFNSATLTISAASSGGPSQGLFPTAEDRKNMDNTGKLSYFSPDGRPEFVYVRARTEDVFNINEPVHSSLEIKNPHLQSRGWVLQEDQLSPRMLHFRKEELAWTCSTYSRCECRIRPSLPQVHPFRLALGVEKTSPELTRTLGMYWPTIVMEYSRRNLTKPSDRIAALCGLANYMQAQTTDTYYCGLWYEDMAFQLLWYVDKQNDKTPADTRFKSPFAPSWSWMSVPAQINYWNRFPIGNAPRHHAIQSDDAVDSYLRVVSIGRIPVDFRNPVGPLIRGELLLYAYVLPVRFESKSNQWETTMYHIEDMVPSILRSYIDVEEDLPENNPDQSHVFIFAGRWVGQGITISSFETVCILARRLAQGELDAILSNKQLEKKALVALSKRKDRWKDFRPETTNSYSRIGLVRNAGSIKAWQKAEIPFEPTFLF